MTKAFERRPRTSSTSGRDGQVTQDARTRRYELREQLQTVTALSRVRSCGSVVGQAVSISHSPGKGGFKGVETCGSVWACPVCQAKIATKRQMMINSAMTAHRGEDADGVVGRVAMLTLTMRHRYGQSLDELWDGLSSAWRYLTQSKTWRGLGLIGHIRATEITHGSNGWHVHLHVALLLPAQSSDSAQSWAARSAGAIFERWELGLGLGGFSSSSSAQDLKIFQGENVGEALSGYFMKAAMEITRGDLKQAKAAGGRTPMGILAEYFRDGDVEDLALWREYERASKGRRQLTLSRSVRALLDAEAAAISGMSDEELASQQEEGVTLVKVRRDAWNGLVKPNGFLQAALLSAASLDSAEAAFNAVVLLLDAYGVAWELPPSS